MRLSSAVVYLSATTSVASAFTVAFSNRGATPTTIPTTFCRTRASACTLQLQAALSNNDLNNNNNNLHEFDHLLGEHQTTTTTTASSQVVDTYSRRRIALGENADGKRVMLASSFAAPSQAVQQEEQAGDADTDDPYANLLDDSNLPLNKIQNYQEQQITKPGFEARLKQMDLQDIIVTIVVPSILVFAGARWGYNKVSGRVMESGDLALNAFAKNMIYHDGDFNKMKMAVLDYNKKLLWMGPAKKDAMLKRYLEAYAKKKTVSPKAISSLSYAFSLFGLSEEKAASVLVSLCRQMGTEKISSAGKLLFLGSRILKSPEGKKALLPIKELIMSTYREEAVAESMVETSQQAMAEASYRATILAAGKKQSKLTVGWEVLGLSRETAQRMYDEEAKQGFISEREAMYGGQKRKYDKKGNQLNDDGKLADPEEAAAAAKEEAADEGPVSNVHECSQCGFTLFVAQGREDKFFGANFECPECGASKDQFTARDDFGEE